MKIILEGTVGSYAYGLNNEDSDKDTLGIYVVPTEEILGIKKPKESIVKNNPDVTYHEVEKFVKLALKCNPTILELLFLPEYNVKTVEGECIVNIRKSFLSNIIIHSYGGYAISQIRRLQKTGHYNKGLQNRFEKHTRHCFRLIQQGKELLETGNLTVKVENREELLELGKKSIDVIVNKFNTAFVDFEKTKSILPDRPDFEVINDYLLFVRRKNYESFTSSENIRVCN